MPKVGMHKFGSGLCTATPTTHFTVPDGKEWHLKMVSHLTDGTATANSIYISNADASNIAYILSNAATNSTVFVSNPLDIWLEAGDRLLTTTTDAGARTCWVYDDFDVVPRGRY